MAIDRNTNPYATPKIATPASEVRKKSATTWHVIVAISIAFLSVMWFLLGLFIVALVLFDELWPFTFDQTLILVVSILYLLPAGFSIAGAKAPGKRNVKRAVILFVVAVVIPVTYHVVVE